MHYCKLLDKKLQTNDLRVDCPEHQIDMMYEVTTRIAAIKDRMAAACLHAGRQPSDVRLLLATKTVLPDRIKAAFAAGETLLGENKVQELRDKFEALGDVPHEKHFIGHLQTNKIKDVLKYGVSCIQSLDRLSLAEKLDQRLRNAGRTMDVLAQVNTSGEASKFGLQPAEVPNFVRELAKFPTLRVKGLMTIGLFSSDAEKTRPCFRLLRELRDAVRAMNLPQVAMQELSMGMSGDLEVAIEEGATLIRVGTAIFGERVHPDSYYWPERSS